MSGGRTVRAGLVPAAAVAAALTALATIAVHARHVSAGYALEKSVRDTVRLEREIRRLETHRAELLAPAAVRATAERLEVPLGGAEDDRPTSIDLDAFLRERAVRVERSRWTRGLR